MKEDTVQWFDPKLGKFILFDKGTRKQIRVKTTDGAYKGVVIRKTKPVASSASKGAPTIAQWLNPISNRFQQFDLSTGLVICTKHREGPYKKLDIRKRKPRLTKKGRGILDGTIKSTALTPKPRKYKKVNYLNNKDLLAEVITSLERDQMTDKLAHMLQVLTSRYARRPGFSGYTYIEDMQAFAMMMLVRTWRSFNPQKSQNPFCFFTQCVHNSFIQFLNKEKRQRDIRDSILVNHGMDPSHTFLEEHARKVTEEREERAQANAAEKSGGE